MSWVPWVPAGLVLLLAVWWVVVRFILPWREFGRILSRLAEGDYRSVIMGSVSPSLSRTSGNLRKVAETLARQKELLEEEEFSLSLILGSMNEGVVITGADLRLRVANPAAASLFQREGDLIGLELSEAFPSHELQRLASRAIASATLQRGELSLSLHQEGERHHLLVTAAPLRSTPGKSDGVLIVLHDVTRLRELEAVRREFVANVSHEFRTPLSVITGYLETLQEGGVDKETTLAAYDAMRRHTERLNLLIADLLSISHIEEKGILLEAKPIDLGDLLRDVVDQSEREIAERAGSVRLTVQEGMPRIMLDPYRIEQAFANLLTNALRHGSTDGGCHVEITARLVGGEVAVGFGDDGPGIPLADQPHLFDRFYRVGGDRARKSGGTGLGLSIVKHIVSAHDGRIVLESSPGKGALFTIYLPVNR